MVGSGVLSSVEFGGDVNDKRGGDFDEDSGVGTKEQGSGQCLDKPNLSSIFGVRCPWHPMQPQM